VYGSDAVAGVANFITRDDFSGLNIEAIANTTEKNDAQSYKSTWHTAITLPTDAATSL